jgi:hypothetical protein
VPGSGTGLIGLTERLELAGGRLEWRNADGEFRLSAWLPWPDADGLDPTGPGATSPGVTSGGRAEHNVTRARCDRQEQRG